MEATFFKRLDGVVSELLSRTTKSVTVEMATIASSRALLLGLALMGSLGVIRSGFDCNEKQSDRALF